MEKRNIDYKDVNDNKFEFIGQIKATVKTNTTSLQLLLLITDARVTPLMGPDWMKRLKRTIKSNTEAIKKHNIRRDETQKKILKLKNEFKDLHGNENLDGKYQPKGKHGTTVKRTNTNPPTRPGSRRTEKLDEERTLRKSNRNN